VIQAAPKLVVAPGFELGVGWMAIAAVMPWAILLVPVREARARDASTLARRGEPPAR
jgi:hypothetical protein